MTVGDASWQLANARQVTELSCRFGGESKQGNSLVVDFDLTNNGNKAVIPSTEPVVLSDNEGSELKPCVPWATQKTRPIASSSTRSTRA